MKRRHIHTSWVHKDTETHIIDKNDKGNKLKENGRNTTQLKTKQQTKLDRKDLYPDKTFSCGCSYPNDFWTSIVRRPNHGSIKITHRTVSFLRAKYRDLVQVI